MSESDVANAVISWVNSFDGLSQPCACISDLSDGVVIMEILSQIAPGHFDATTLKKGTSGNWILKNTNIKRLLKHLESYYQEVLHAKEVDFSYIDVTSVSKEEDTNEIIKIVELVLGCLFTSDNKEVLVANIMQLDQAHQTELMLMMQKVMDKYALYENKQDNVEAPSEEMDKKDSFYSQDMDEMNDYYNMSELKTVSMTPRGGGAHEFELERDLRQTSIALEDATRERKKLQQELEELQREYETLKHEKESLLEENADLTKRLTSAFDEKIRTPTAPTETEQQDNLSSKSELMQQLEEKEKRINELAKKNEELMKLIGENRALQDEIDILKTKAAQVENLQSQLDKYKKKIEEAGELRKKLKVIEEQTNQYINRNLDLEEENKKLALACAQLETYKNQVTDLSSKNLTLSSTISQQEKELQKLNELRLKLETENESYKSQIATLQQRVDSLQHDNEMSAMMSPSQEGNAFSDSFGEILSPEIKEKIMRLERENDRLRQEKQTADGATSNEISSKLDDALRLNTKLQSEYTNALEKIKSLEGQVTSLRSEVTRLQESNRNQATALEAAMQAKNSLNGIAAANTAAHEALIKKVQELEAVNKALVDANNKQLDDIKSLVQASKEFSRKEKELVQADRNWALKNQENERMIEELKRQLSAATKFDLNEMEIVKNLKNNIKRLEEENKHLKNKIQSQKEDFNNKWREAKEASEMEQRLVISAFYEMGMENTRVRHELSRYNLGANRPSSSSMNTSAIPLNSWMNLRRQGILSPVRK